MNKNNGTTSDLTISSKNIHNCGEVVEKLRQCGISSNVSPQTTIICKGTSCWTEKGCNIRITDLDQQDIEKKVWIPLKNRFDLTCAHLNVHGNYIGCIRNFIRPSHCPESFKNFD